MIDQQYTNLNEWQKINEALKEKRRNYNGLKKDEVMLSPRRLQKGGQRTGKGERKASPEISLIDGQCKTERREDKSQRDSLFARTQAFYANVRNSGHSWIATKPKNRHMMLFAQSSICKEINVAPLTTRASQKPELLLEKEQTLQLTSTFQSKSPKRNILPRLAYY